MAEPVVRKVRFNAVTGKVELSTRPVTAPIARPYILRSIATADQISIRQFLAAFPPPALAKRYFFPEPYDGTGETIGILELGGGYIRSALDSYCPSRP